MILSMDLAGILERIESRLRAVGLSATKASQLAGKPGAIRNIRRAVKEGRRRGMTSTTLIALAPILKTTGGWLLTGHDEDEASDRAEVEATAAETLDARATETALAWVFLEIGRSSGGGSSCSGQSRRMSDLTASRSVWSAAFRSNRHQLIGYAVQLFRSRETQTIDI